MAKPGNTYRRECNGTPPRYALLESKYGMLATRIIRASSIQFHAQSASCAAGSILPPHASRAIKTVRPGCAFPHEPRRPSGRRAKPAQPLDAGSVPREALLSPCG